MVETTKTKYIEATQFTREEYEKHATSGGPPLTSEYKKGAFVKLSDVIKDSKSELNVSLGGMKNVRRVRVLRDANIKDDTAAAPGNLVLVFDLLSAAKNTPLRQAPVQPAVARTFHLFMEVLSRVDNFIGSAQEQAKEGRYPEEFQTHLTMVKMLISVDQSQVNFLRARDLLRVLMLQARKETEADLKFYNMLDYLQNLMMICSIESAIGPARLLELVALIKDDERKGPFVKDKKPHRNGNVKGPSKLGLLPNPAATAVANELLLIPNAMLLMARQLADINKQINQVADDFESLVNLIVKRQAPSTPAPGIFFLNEAHETHITKAQARREREAARDIRLAKATPDKKTASKGKLAVGPLAPRKRRTIGTVHR